MVHSSAENLETLLKFPNKHKLSSQQMTVVLMIHSELVVTCLTMSHTAPGLKASRLARSGTKAVVHLQYLPHPAVIDAL